MASEKTNRKLPACINCSQPTIWGYVHETAKTSTDVHACLKCHNPGRTLPNTDEFDPWRFDPTRYPSGFKLLAQWNGKQLVVVSNAIRQEQVDAHTEPPLLTGADLNELTAAAK